MLKYPSVDGKVGIFCALLDRLRKTKKLLTVLLKMEKKHEKLM